MNNEGASIPDPTPSLNNGIDVDVLNDPTISNFKYIKNPAGNDSFELGAEVFAVVDNGVAGDDTFIRTGDIAGTETWSVIDGGAGNDTIDYSQIAYGVEASAASGGTVGEGGLQPFDVFDNIEAIIGSAYADTITGGTEANTLDGGDGDDFLDGFAGDNVLIGGYGTDTILGSDGADSIVASPNNDVTVSGIVEGGAGNDTIIGGGDSQYTQAEFDSIFADGRAATNSTIYGGEGNDSIDVTGDFHAVFGGDGDDTIAVNGGAENAPFPSDYGYYIYFDEGNDLPLPASYVAGGNGVDTYTSIDGFERVKSVISDSDGQFIVDFSFNITSIFQTTEEYGERDYFIPVWRFVTDQGDIDFAHVNGTSFFGKVGNTGFPEPLDVVRPLASNVAAVNSITVTTDGNARFNFTPINSTLDAENDSGLFADNNTPPPGQDIAGTSGNDVLTGTAGSDTISGFQGDDTIEGNEGADTIYGAEGSDSINGGDDDDSISGWENDDTLLGGSGDDSLFGDQGNDLLEGGAGNDFFFGFIGNDTMFGGEGNDTQNGEDGDDFLNGDDGDDSVIGGEGADTVYGWYGDDTVIGGGGNDSVLGDWGNDSVFGGDGNDTVFGFDGNDTMFGGDGADLLSGEADNDAILGEAGNDNIYGGAGNDYLWGDAGADYMEGGAGADGFAYNLASDSTASLTDFIGDFSQSDGDVIDLSAFGGLSFIGTNSFSGGQEVRYSQNSGNTVIEVDTDGNSAADLTVLLGGTINLSVNDFVGVTQVSYNEITGTNNADNLFGTSGADRIRGLDKIDTINGGAGDDILIGGERQDYLTGSAGSDIFLVEQLSESFRNNGTGVYRVDFIQDFEVGVDKIDVSALGFTGLGNGTSGTLDVKYQSGNNRTIVESLDTNANGDRFVINLEGGDYTGTLTANDFLF